MCESASSHSPLSGYWPAPRERGGSRPQRSSLRPLRFLERGIGFAPEAIALAAIRRDFFSFDQEKPMTAYLISLALLGLVVIAATDLRS